MKAGNGKIARLPKAIREQLNQRLADGEPCGSLLGWLHSLPEVIEVLVRDFGARAILKQNLSEWRQGGFREWEARQERLAQLRLLSDEADDVEAASPHLPDRMAALLAGRFASLIAATMQVKDWSKPRHRAQLMELNEAVATLRRFDQGAARLKLECEQLEIKRAELKVAQEAQMKRTHEQWREWARQQFDRLDRECKTPEELVEAIDSQIFGDKYELKRAQGQKAGSTEPDRHTQWLEDVAGLIKRRDELKADYADIEFREKKLQMQKVEAGDAIREAMWDVLSKECSDFADEDSSTKNPPSASKESQTRSNLVKPTCTAPVSTDSPAPSTADQEREEPSQQAPIAHPPEGDKEAEKASRPTEDELENLHEEDLGGDWLEPGALRSENIIVLPEPPGRTTLGRLC